jgi:hypothetical protein
MRLQGRRCTEGVDTRVVGGVCVWALMKSVTLMENNAHDVTHDCTPSDPPSARYTDCFFCQEAFHRLDTTCMTTTALTCLDARAM